MEFPLLKWASLTPVTNRSQAFLPCRKGTSHSGRQDSTLSWKGRRETPLMPAMSQQQTPVGPNNEKQDRVWGLLYVSSTAKCQDPRTAHGSGTYGDTLGGNMRCRLQERSVTHRGVSYVQPNTTLVGHMCKCPLAKKKKRVRSLALLPNQELTGILEPTKLNSDSSFYNPNYWESVFPLESLRGWRNTH